MNTKIKNNAYKLLFPSALLIVCIFCYAQSARADDNSVTKYGVVFDNTNGVGTPNYARIIKKDGVYHMWYEDTETKTLYHATSADGKIWAQEIQCGGTDNLVHEPSVIWDGDKFKMWFESRVQGENGVIRYLESADGIDWGPSQMAIWTNISNTEHNAWENGGRYMPYVMKENGTYKMWYQSFSIIEGEGGDKRINYATSSDGINWDNSGEFHQVTFGAGEDNNNNIVLGRGDGGSWDSASLYSQVIIKLPPEADFNYAMLYAAHDGGRHKIGAAASNDGISWMTESDYLISEEHDIWFPSITEEENGFYVWYMDSAGGKVYFATLPFRNQMDNNNNNPQKAHIDSWTAYQYQDQNGGSCQTKLKLTIEGKYFKKDAEVRIGGKKASSVNVKNSKRLTAKFCLSKLLDVQTDHKRVISVTNPDTNTEKADKKINLDDIGYDMSAEDFNSQTVEGVKSIQTALVQLGLLDSRYITGIYGPITTEAVRKFQEQNGLPTTGFVGPLTKAKLEEKLK